MYIQTIVDALERVAPLSLQEPWDNSGLQVGRLTGSCSAMVAALDATLEVVETAVAQGAELIVTHHPLLIKGINVIDTDQAVGRIIELLIKHNITLYAMHTPADSTTGGLNDRMMSALSVEQGQPLDEHCGYGRIGTLNQPTDIKDFIAQITRAFSLSSSVAYAVPTGKTKIERVAVCSGSGTSMIDAAARARADVLVCGDIKHHDFQRALELNLALIDATHYATEIGFVDWVNEMLADIQKKNTTFALHLHRNNFISYYTR